jgi:hypothetical protein
MALVFGKTIFYYEAYEDKNTNERRKTVCVKELTNDSKIVEGFYARGSTVCSLRDTYRKATGRTIAKQRADKAAEEFAGSYDVGFLIKYKEFGHGMTLVTVNELSDLEKHLLGLDKPKPSAEEMPVDAKKPAYEPQIPVGPGNDPIL